MKYTQAIVILAGLVAAVLGIYTAESAPYTEIAAGAVGVAAVVGIAQAFQADRESEFVKQILSHLARSTPASQWWKEKVNEMVRSNASSHGYVLKTILWDASNPEEPTASTIFVFRSPGSSGSTGGVLVITPDDYAELALCSESQLRKKIDGLVVGTWDVDSSADAADRIRNTAVALYGLCSMGGFRMSMQLHDASTPLVIQLGEVRLSFDSAEVEQLLADAPIRRDLRIAGALEGVEPRLTKYVNALHSAL